MQIHGNEMAYVVVAMPVDRVKSMILIGTIYWRLPKPCYLIL